MTSKLRRHSVQYSGSRVIEVPAGTIKLDGGGRRFVIRKDPDSNVKLTALQLETLGRRYRLAPREKQILSLLFEGLPTNQAIADRLDTTEAAIKAGVRTLYLKTRTESKHEMIRNLMLDLLHEHYRTTDPFPTDAKEGTD